MERSWDRVHAFKRLDRGEIEGLVQPAELGRVRLAEPLSAGLRNTNYRLSFESGRNAVLRLYVADPSACGREAAILRLLARAVPAPGVVYADPGALPPFALLEWLEGTPLDEVLGAAAADEAVEIAAACGGALAAIHRVRFGAAGFLGPDLAVERPMPPWAEAIGFELAGAAPLLGARMAAAVAGLVAARREEVEAVWRREPVLVHADFKPWNLLFSSGAVGAGSASRGPGVPGAAGRASVPGDASTGHWRLTGAVDWEFACSGCRLIDFGTFLRDLGSRPLGYGEAFSEAYVAAGGLLPAEWRRLTLLVDLLSLLQMAGRSAGRATDDLRRLIETTVASVG
jgi:Ser/Thr protein kinase RdoA (MazF antagonist)